MIILDLLNTGSKILKNNKVQTYQIDAEIILASLLKKRREQIIRNCEEKVSNSTINNFNKLINRRSSWEPLAYILRQKEFWSKSFFVNRSTLIPRPETELLCDIVIKKIKNRTSYILDIGTGSGCILLSILSEIKKAKGIGIDISKKAIEVAKKNSNKLGLNQRAKFFTKSLNNIRNCKFDLDVHNPPYIKNFDLKNMDDEVVKYEPKLALDGGLDGLSEIRKVVSKSSELVKIHGKLILEIAHDQKNEVKRILRNNNFYINEVVKDFANKDRCIISTKI